MLAARTGLPESLSKKSKEGLFHELTEHKFAGSNINGRFGMVGPAFVVFGEPTVATEPSKGALNNPTFGQDLEARVGAFDDFQLKSAPGNQVADPLQELSRIASVGKNLAHPAEAQQGGQQEFRSIAILERGTVDDDRKDQSEGIYQKVSFSSVDLLASVIATFSGLLSHFNTLAVDNRSGRGFFFPPLTRT